MNRRPWQAAVLVAVVLLALAGVATWRLRAWNQWLLADSATLDPFPTRVHPAPDTPADPLDAALAADAMQGRLVVELTRSSYWRGLLGREYWVKSCLVTRIPGDSEALRRLKLLHRLTRGPDGAWRVTSVEELAVP